MNKNNLIILAIKIKMKYLKKVLNKVKKQKRVLDQIN